MRSRPFIRPSKRLTASLVKAMLLWMRVTCSANSCCNSAASLWLSAPSKPPARRRNSLSFSSWACNASSFSALHFRASSARKRVSSSCLRFASASNSWILALRRSRAAAPSSSAALRSASAAAGSFGMAPAPETSAQLDALLLTRWRTLSTMSFARRCSSPMCANSGPSVLPPRSAVSPLHVEAGDTSADRRRECSKDFCCSLASMASVSRRKISRKSCTDIATETSQAAAAE
mmetsp:Transcript_70326/g.186913  ORF Transcript_70326/g.186913 Transcript_70326/m.186913 type:complete len:233 (-) Transcript_70326:49-747(-)